MTVKQEVETRFFLVICYFVICSLLTIQFTESLDLKQCRSSLGMQAGEIPDYAITASSSLDVINLGPESARIRSEKNGGAWCPKEAVSKDSLEYLQIDFGRLKVITLVETQGRFGHGQGQEFTEQYFLYYQREELGPWFKFKNRRGQELFQGNANTYIAELREVSPPLIARRIRLMPYSTHPKTVCLRVELYGCDWKDGIVSYGMHQGDRHSSDLDLSDLTYDGFVTATHLEAGLGQLTDGEEGQSNYRLDQHRLGIRGYDWVGWRNETFNSDQPAVEIDFKFDAVRNFSALKIYSNNQFSKDVRTFRAAEVWFSADGVDFAMPPIEFRYERDTVIEYSREVVIPLEGRLGRYVRLRLHFDALWIMISEVHFESEYVPDFKQKQLVEVNASQNTALNDVTTDLAINDNRNYSRYAPSVKDLSNHIKNEAAVLQIVPMTSTSHDVIIQEELDDSSIVVIIGVLSAITAILFVVLFIVVVRHRRYTCMPTPQFPIPKTSLTDLSAEPNICAATSKTSANDSDLEILQDSQYKTYQSYQIRNLQESISPTHQPSYAGSPSRTLRGNHVAQTLTPEHRNTVNSDMLRQFYETRSPSKSQAHNSKMNLLISEDRSANVSPALIAHENLRLVEQLGTSRFGEVQLSEFLTSRDIFQKNTLGMRSSAKPTLAVVKWLNQTANDHTRVEFLSEVQKLLDVDSANVSHVIGLCTTREPLCVCTEYSVHGDLKQFLRKHEAEGYAPKNNKSKLLSYGSLLYMASQIASGMKHLEYVGVVHRDLSTRNCLVWPHYCIKVSDLGSGRTSRHRTDYCAQGRYTGLPLRWMAWETVLMGKYSSESDVWSFAVTVWEILTLARRLPLSNLTDDQVIENCTHQRQNDGFETFLDQPNLCHKEIYDLLRECWNADETNRPTFREIHMFLLRKNMGYSPELDSP